jgi:hypothetical protein
MQCTRPLIGPHQREVHTRDARMPHAQQPNGKQRRAHANATTRTCSCRDGSSSRVTGPPSPRARAVRRSTQPWLRERCAARVGIHHMRGRDARHIHQALAVRATQTWLQERCAARACIHHMRVRDARHITLIKRSLCARHRHGCKIGVPLARVSPHAGPQRATHHTHQALAVRATQTRLRERCAARACIHHMRVRNAQHITRSKHSLSARHRHVCESNGRTRYARTHEARNRYARAPPQHPGTARAHATRNECASRKCRWTHLTWRHLSIARRTLPHAHELPAHAQHTHKRKPTRTKSRTTELRRTDPTQHTTQTYHGRSTRPPRAWNKRNTVCPLPAWHLILTQRHRHTRS